MTRRGRGRPPHPGILTAAEQRVLAELRRGGTNAEIAVRLGVTLDAVKFHISNMLGKLQLENREQLAAWRPEPRRRLFGLLAVPGTLEPIGRLLVWAGVAAAGAAAVAVVVVVLIVLSSLDGSEQQLAFAPTATPTATATPTPAPAVTPAVCKTSADPTCIRAVYLGAPGDYAQVADIPAGVLLTPDADGRYPVERGQQYTVVTAAPLPAGWTRFWLDWSPLEFGTPSPLSFAQLIQPVGTTYTFTATEDEAASTLITFDLKQARPFVRPRPDGKPEIGATVVTTKFLVPTLRYNRLDTTGAATAAGSYAFLTTAGDATSAIENFGFLPGRGVELRIHPADASGASRAAFYDTVTVGDRFDYRTNGLDCGFRFKVTSLGAPTTPRTFGIERIRRYGTRCGDAVDDPGAARDVEFVWRVRTGLPGADGVRVLIPDEPIGQERTGLPGTCPGSSTSPQAPRSYSRGSGSTGPWSAATCRIQPLYSGMWRQARRFTSIPRRAGPSTASSLRMRRMLCSIRSPRRSGAWRWSRPRRER